MPQHWAEKWSNSNNSGEEQTTYSARTSSKTLRIACKKESELPLKKKFSIVSLARSLSSITRHHLGKYMRPDVAVCHELNVSVSSKSHYRLPAVNSVTTKWRKIYYVSEGQSQLLGGGCTPMSEFFLSSLKRHYLDKYAGAHSPQADVAILERVHPSPFCAGKYYFVEFSELWGSKFKAIITISGLLFTFNYFGSWVHSPSLDCSMAGISVKKSAQLLGHAFAIESLLLKWFVSGIIDARAVNNSLATTWRCFSFFLLLIDN